MIVESLIFLLSWFHIGIMAFSYPKFHGKKHEDVDSFLEQMEIACITNHVLDPTQIICLIQIFLKGNEQAWFKYYEEGLQRANPPLPLNLGNLKQALVEEFVKEKDPEKVWQDKQETIQKKEEPLGDYV